MDVVDWGTGEVHSVKGLMTFADQMLFHEAFLGLQKALPMVLGKDEKNPHFKSKYLSLHKIVQQVYPILQDHGFTISQGCSFSAFTETSSKCAYIEIFTEIVHVETCISKRTKLPIPLPKLDPQAVGSATKYGRRYTLMLALGIADGDDDDAEAAMPRRITECAKESPELAALKRDMSKIKEATELVAWVGDPKVDARIQSLSDAETEMLRTFFANRRNALVKQAQEAA